MGGDGGGFGKGGFGGKKGGKKGKGKGKKGSPDDEPWTPVTKLGRLVKDNKITSLEDIYLHALPVREYQIINHLYKKVKDEGVELKDEVCCIKPVQKMTSAGQRNRFVAYAVVGDGAGHIGLGSKCGKEVRKIFRY
jgi:small subunit ribosomal protein S2e